MALAVVRVVAQLAVGIGHNQFVVLYVYAIFETLAVDGLQHLQLPFYGYQFVESRHDEVAAADRRVADAYVVDKAVHLVASRLVGRVEVFGELVERGVLCGIRLVVFVCHAAAQRLAAQV